MKSQPSRDIITINPTASESHKISRTSCTIVDSMMKERSGQAHELAIVFTEANKHEPDLTCKHKIVCSYIVYPFINEQIAGTTAPANHVCALTLAQKRTHKHIPTDNYGH